eukprot:UN26873
MKKLHTFSTDIQFIKLNHTYKKHEENSEFLYSTCENIVVITVDGVYQQTDNFSKNICVIPSSKKKLLEQIVKIEFHNDLQIYLLNNGELYFNENLVKLSSPVKDFAATINGIVCVLENSEIHYCQIITGKLNTTNLLTNSKILKHKNQSFTR